MERPPFYPWDGTYADILFWHLYIWGTRNDGSQHTWTAPEFRKAVFESNAEKESPVRLLNYWLGAGPRPNPTNANLVLQALFGDDPRFEHFRVDLRAAWAASKGVGKNIRTRNLDRASDATSVVQISAQLPFAHHQWHKVKAEPTNLIELLRTDLRATTLVGRAGELAMLSGWLSSPQGIAVKCIIGGAGAGKTRLAIEACEAAEAAGWFATFVPGSELKSFDDWHCHANRKLPQPTLIVVDYAASSAPAIERWFNELAPMRNCSGNRLRILLLERHADRDSGWWADLLRPLSNAHATSAALIGSETPYRLPPLDAIRERRALLAEVMAKAATLFDPPLPKITPPLAGEEPWFDERLKDDRLDNEPLYLAMAGIRAVECGAPTALSLNRLELARHIATIEERRIERFASTRGFSDNGKFLKHIVACITLQNGCLADNILSLVREEREHLGLSAPFDDERLAEIVCDYLPYSDRIEPVRPDLIGESFSLHIINGSKVRDAQTQAAIVLRSYRRSQRSTIDTLIRCAVDLAAGQSDHCAIRYLEEIAKDNSDAAIDIALSLPSQTLALREFAERISWFLLEVIRKGSWTNPSELTTHLIVALTRLSDFLTLMGRRKASLEAMGEAVTSGRRLITGQPELFKPLLLAKLLQGLAATQIDIGDFSGALASVNEAIEIFRTSSYNSSDNEKEGFAAALGTLSLCLSSLGDTPAALGAIEKSVELYRHLSAGKPGAFRDDLAVALMGYSSRLLEFGQPELASEAAEECVALSRELAAEQPDAFTPQLADALGALSNSQSTLGRWAPALASAEAAVALHRPLASQRPDAFGYDLATDLSNLALRLSDLGREEEALVVSEEAITIWRELANTLPDAFLGPLASALNNLSNRLSDLEKGDEALAAADEAVQLNRRIAAERPERPMPDLALSLGTLASRLHHSNRPKAALDASSEATVFYRPLAEAIPHVYRYHLAATLAVSADCLDELGQTDQAIMAISEAVKLCRTDSFALPLARKATLASLLFKYSQHLRRVTRPEDALSVADESTRMWREIEADRPGVFSLNLAIGLHHFAIQYVDAGMLTEAIPIMNEAANTYVRICTGKADNILVQTVRALYYFGGLLEKCGDTSAAASQDHCAISLLRSHLKHYREDIAIFIQNYARRCEVSGCQLDEDLILPILSRWQGSD